MQPIHYVATPACSLRSELGETPRIDARTDELIWTDITGGMVHRGTVQGTTIMPVHSYDVGAKAGPVTPLVEPESGWIMAHGTSLSHLGIDGAISSLASPEDSRPAVFNDGVADPTGNLWVGSMGTQGRSEAGRLWRFDTSGNEQIVLEGIGISNGLDFTADGRTAYYVDTSTRLLQRLDLDGDGGITARTNLVAFPPGGGDPDGLVLDAEGCIWVALWDGWAVHRYSPVGELLAIVEVPVSRPTAVALSGDLLIITTCSGWLPEDWRQHQPDAGRLFTVRVAADGVPARPYRGALGSFISGPVPAPIL